MDLITNTNNLLLIFIFLSSGLTLILINVVNNLKYKSLNTYEFVDLINKCNAQIVDIRTANQFQSEHIAKSQNLPIKEYNTQNLKKLKLDKSKPIIILALNNTQAITFMKKIKKMGYLKIFYIHGGVPALKEAGLLLVQ